ncbi:MAG: rod shape-determining protein MreC [Lachnospiraceae bacterium]|nr:rod shape-determining protein MreC [Lachnospiraceae bacterium]
MSPYVPKKQEKFSLPTKYWMMILIAACLILLVVTFLVDIPENPAGFVTGYTIVPMQKGITSIGSYLVDRKEMLVRITDLQKENEELKNEITALNEENIQLKQDKFELIELRKLFDLNEMVADYEKTGATVIAAGTGNWFDSFIIDKGKNAGIKRDMNVLAGGGLCGRVVEVGPNWSRVMAVIDDTSNVSAQVLSTSDRLIVSGDLQSMKENHIRFSDLYDDKNQVAVGDKVVTSNISDKFLPGILIGYISSIETDPNNLTKSGYITPAVDFAHLSEVIVILQNKQVVETEK